MEHSCILDYCPDCVQIIDNNTIVVSSYDFVDDNTKTGVLLLLNNQLQIVDKLNCDGILHFKAIDNNITLCTWKGECWLIKIQDAKFIIVSKKSYTEQFEAIKLLFLDCDNDGRILVGGDNGEVILQHNEDILFSQRSHQYSVWCTLLDNQDPNLFYSGSDDACLNYYDSRVGVIRKDKKSHTQGVTYILNHGEFQLITGCFDGEIRIFDKRQPNNIVQSYKRDGGIWRIIKKGNQYLNALFQDQLYELIEITDTLSVKRVFKDHNSLAYAVDWKDNLIVTSSFYDKQLRWYQI